MRDGRPARAGVATLADNDRLVGIASIAVGLTAGLGGILLVDQGLKQWLRQRWTAMTADPDTTHTDNTE